MTRILVADDDALQRAGIVMLVSSQPDFQVVGEAANGDEAVGMSRLLHPDVVLMDLQMPGTDGVEATRLITEDPEDNALRDRPIKVLVLTTFSQDDWVYRALRAGAHGFLLKKAAPQDLSSAIRKVASGDAWIDPAVAGRVIEALAQAPEPAFGGGRIEQVARLTAREREVFVLVASGMSNQEIADQLVLSLATVRTHVARVLMKTGSRDRAQAVALAYQTGVVAPRRGFGRDPT